MSLAGSPLLRSVARAAICSWMASTEKPPALSGEVRMASKIASHGEALENLLRDRPQLLPQLADQLPCLLWTADAQLQYTSSAGAALAALGMQPGDLDGASVLDYHAADSAVAEAH